MLIYVFFPAASGLFVPFSLSCTSNSLTFLLAPSNFPLSTLILNLTSTFPFNPTANFTISPGIWTVFRDISGERMLVSLRNEEGMKTNDAFYTVKVGNVGEGEKCEVNVSELEGVRASFSEDLGEIRVKVPVWMREMMDRRRENTECGMIIAEKGGLGRNPECFWTTDTDLTVNLGNLHSVEAGPTLTIQGQGVKVGLWVPEPAVYPQPEARITVTSVPGDWDSVMVDCYASTGTGKRPFNCTWWCSDSLAVTSPTYTFTHIASLNLTLTLTNFRFQSSSTSLSFPGTLSVFFPFGSSLQITKSSELLLHPTILGSNVNPDHQDLHYQWSSDSPVITSFCQNNYHFCRIPPGVLSYGQFTVVFEVVKNDNRQGKTEIQVKVVRSRRNVLVKGVNSVINADNSTYILDGSLTIDPDTGKSLNLLWSFLPPISFLPLPGEKLTLFPLQNLQIDVNYTISVCLESDKSVERTYWLKMVRNITGNVTINPVFDAFGRGNVELNAVLVGIDPEKCVWSQKNPHFSEKYASFSRLVLPIRGLVPSARYSFEYICGDIKASVSFGVNSPPKGGYFVINPAYGVAGKDYFSLIAGNWYDPEGDYPLTYQILDPNGRKCSLPSLSPTATTYFAPSDSPVSYSVSVCDGLQSCTQSLSNEVTVERGEYEEILSGMREPQDLLQAYQMVGVLEDLQREGRNVAKSLSSVNNAVRRCLDYGEDRRDEEGFTGAICSIVSSISSSFPHILPFRMLNTFTPILTNLSISSAVSDCLPALSSLALTSELRFDTDSLEDITASPVRNHLEELLLSVGSNMHHIVIPGSAGLMLAYPGVSMWAYNGPIGSIRHLPEVTLPVRNGTQSYTVKLPADWSAGIDPDMNVHFVVYTSVLPTNDCAPLYTRLRLNTLEISVSKRSINMTTNGIGITFKEFRAGIRGVYPTIWIKGRKWLWDTGALDLAVVSLTPNTTAKFVHTLPIVRDNPIAEQWCRIVKDGRVIEKCSFHRNDSQVTCSCTNFGAARFQETLYSGSSYSPITRAEVIIQNTFNGSVFLVLLIYAFLVLIAMVLVVLDVYDKPKMEEIERRFEEMQEVLVASLVRYEGTVKTSSPGITSLPALFSLAPSQFPSVFPQLLPYLRSLPSFSHADKFLSNVHSFLSHPSYVSSIRFSFFQYQLGIRSLHSTESLESSHSFEVVTDDLVGKRTWWAVFVWENELLGLLFMRMSGLMRISRFPIFVISVLGPLYSYASLVFQARRDSNDIGHAVIATKGQFWGGTDTVSTILRTLIFILITVGLQKAILWLQFDKPPITLSSQRIPSPRSLLSKSLVWVKFTVTRLLPWVLSLYLFLLCIIIMWNFTLEEMEAVLINNVISIAFEFFLCFHCVAGAIVLGKYLLSRLKAVFRAKKKVRKVISLNRLLDSSSNLEGSYRQPLN